MKNTKETNMYNRNSSSSIVINDSDSDLYSLLLFSLISSLSFLFSFILLSFSFVTFLPVQ